MLAEAGNDAIIEVGTESRLGREIGRLLSDPSPQAAGRSWGEGRRTTVTEWTGCDFGYTRRRCLDCCKPEIDFSRICAREEDARQEESGQTRSPRHRLRAISTRCFR